MVETINYPLENLPPDFANFVSFLFSGVLFLFLSFLSSLARSADGDRLRFFSKTIELISLIPLTITKALYTYVET